MGVPALPAQHEAYEENKCRRGQVWNNFKKTCEQGQNFPTFDLEITIEY